VNNKQLISIAVVVAVGIVLAVFILRMNKASMGSDPYTASRQVGDDPTTGPHRGRVLSDGDFQVEVTIYERGVPPQFRVYPYEKGRAINPDEMRLTIQLHRLGGRVDVIHFEREAEYLRGDKVVEEPHSFDVQVIAERKGRTYRWEYSQVEGRIELTAEAVKSSGIVVETVGPMRMKNVIELPGEIALNADKVARVVPRLTGVMTEVRKNLGDKVRKGEVIAVADSRELADLKTEYLAAVKRVELARTTFVREERLWKKKISAEQDYLLSRQALAETEIKVQAAAHKLVALGLSQTDLNNLITGPDHVLTRYEIRAPFAGAVIKKHIAVGEAVKEDATIFVIADLSTVLVDVTVYAKDLNVVKVGQKVTVKSDVLGTQIAGTLTYLGPLVGQRTRSAKARVVIPNPDGTWRPGLFVTVQVVHEEVTVPLAVRAEALQSYRDWEVVFIQVGNIFEVRPLKLGRRNGEWVEVLSGLSPGEKYVSKKSFILKADLEKSRATHEH